MNLPPSSNPELAAAIVRGARLLDDWRQAERARAGRQLDDVAQDDRRTSTRVRLDPCEGDRAGGCSVFLDARTLAAATRTTPAPASRCCAVAARALAVVE